MRSVSFQMKNPKLLVLGLLLASAVLGGVARQIIAPGKPFAQVDIFFILAGAILVFTWFRIDANQRNFKRSPILNVAVVALAAVALPYYFFRTRGFVGGLAATAGFIGIAILFSAIQYAGSYAVYLATQS
jgi:hypothetical protein